jgi:signal transduction histidine kinase/ActR/RegA family two-component response regulator
MPRPGLYRSLAGADEAGMGVASGFQRQVDRIAVTARNASDPLMLRRARLITGFSLAVSPFPILAALAQKLFLPAGTEAAVAIPIASCGLAGLLLALTLVRTGRVALAGNLGSLLALGFITLGVWQSGGVRGATLVWMPVAPVVAVIFAGRRLGLVWALLSLSAIGWFCRGATGGSELLYGISVALVLVLLFLLARMYESESERAVAEIAKVGELARAASRAKSAFLANTSHEIRTPLTAIAGYADLLLEDIDRPVAREERLEMVETIRRNAEHLRRVLGDVLDLSRIEAGRIDLELASVEVAEILRDVTQLMNVQAELKGLSLSLELGPDLPRRVQSDATRLRQVLVNLLGNAIRFTARGGVRVVASRAPSDRLAISVVDTGPGLSAEQLPRIFEPFVQGDSSTTRTHGGTGLGLTISAALVELMGGSLSVDSAPGTGSTFRVELPIGEPQADTTAAARAEPATAAGPPGGLRVLVAEDGPDNQRLIRALLERLGCRVEIVAHGEAALERLAADAKSFDAVLLDMQMPVMDGYATARELRRRGLELPIIALTAHALAEERARCLTAGCTDYLSKPIDRPALADCLARQAFGRDGVRSPCPVPGEDAPRSSAPPATTAGSA